MCGIWIYFGTPHPDDQLVEIPHRGPNSKGRKAFRYLEDVVELAHWRLSILDLSNAGAQPMPYMGDRYFIVFNGEIYNYKELRAELQTQGYSFQSQCDTEVIMAAYDYWGEKCLDRFLGMFSFAIWDTFNKVLFVARDRFGIKPLYYYETPEGVAFASEIKQFLGLKSFQAKMNSQRAIEYLIYGAQDHTAETLFDGVKQLRGGEYLSLSLSQCHTQQSLSPQKWYVLSEQPEYHGSFEEAIEQYHALFSDTINLHLRSDVPIGSCLSGGMDSSSIVCTVNDLLKKEKNTSSQNTFSCCFPEPECDESVYMHAVEAATGARAHHISPSLDQALGKLSHLVWHQDEPLANASIFGQYQLFHEAKKKGVTVMLDGQGGDEQLASYPQFFGLHLWNQYLNSSYSNASSEARALKTVLGWNMKNSLHTLLFWFAPSWGIEPSMIRKKLLGEPLWLDRKYVKRNHLRLSAPWKFDGAESPQLNVPWLSRLMLTRSTLPMLLHWEDRNSMANSVEARIPFLDHRLVEFTLSLPDTFKTYRGSTKRILKSAMQGIVPQKILDRTDKKGFATPEERWFRQQGVNAYREQMLQTTRDVPELFSHRGLVEEINNVLAGHKGYTHVFWRILSFGVWMRTFNVKL